MTIGRVEDASRLPDHGYGPLGRAVHGLLLTGAAPDPPTVAMIYNTLPDPPGPPRCSRFDLVQELWQAVGEDVHRYLIMLARGIRTAPPPDPAKLDEKATNAAPTRLDGLALVYQGAAIRPSAGTAGRAVAANLAEGYYRRGDVAASPAAERALMAMAVDRNGQALLFVASSHAVAPAIPGPPEQQRIEGPLVENLADLLAAFWSMMERADELLKEG